MSHHMPEPDPRSRFEDEGIPDLQDGTPGQQQAVDPQQAPLPGDHPVAVDEYGTTAEEQAGGERLDGRVAREQPEPEPVFGTGAGPGGEDDAPVAGDAPAPGTVGPGEDRVTADSGLGVGADLNTEFQPGDDVDPDSPAQPEEPSGRVWEEPRQAGRLVSPNQGIGPDSEPDEVASEAGPDAGGYSAEESAVRVEPE